MNPAASADDDRRPDAGTKSGSGPGQEADPLSPRLLLDRACRAIISGADVCGVAVTLMSSNGARELVYASDAVAQHLDDIQFTTGIGPCLDAFTSATPVLCPDLRADDYAERWLGFTDDALALGAASVFAFPLTGGPSVFGAIEIYRTWPGDLGSDEYLAASRGAETTAHLLLSLFSGTSVGEVAGSEAAGLPDTDPDRVWDSEYARPQVNHAAGMVSVQMDVGIDDAMATMRSRAYADHRSITDIADDVVARRLNFRHGDSPAGRRESGTS
ncbi:MAG: GAF and ANTAR domain-containing protein [Rhodococcus sp. (in: high G+C Gram-positive bacteria)]